MIIPKYNVIFIHNPKTAGESIIRALGIPPDYIRARGMTRRYKKNKKIFYNRGYHLNWHESLRYHKEYMTGHMNYRSFYKFMFVRHPVDRFISVFKWYKRGGNQSKIDRNICACMPENVNDLAKIIKDIQKKFSNTHFYPQVDIATGLLDDFDFIGRFENLADDWDYIRNHLNIYDKTHDLKKSHERSVTEFSKSEISINSESLNILRDVYREDFDRFGYDINII